MFSLPWRLANKLSQNFIKASPCEFQPCHEYCWYLYLAWGVRATQIIWISRVKIPGTTKYCRSYNGLCPNWMSSLTKVHGTMIVNKPMFLSGITLAPAEAHRWQAQWAQEVVLKCFLEHLSIPASKFTFHTSFPLVLWRICQRRMCFL